MITLTNPRIGTNDKDFSATRKIAQQSGKRVRVVDLKNNSIGFMDKQGNWDEPQVPPLMASLQERLEALDFQHSVSKRHRRNSVATVGLLALYEMQQSEAAA